jgi:dihydrofolate reductase
MRKLILSMMTSLDGCIATADGGLDWFLTDGEFELELMQLLRGVDGMIFGRVAYELLAQFWPTAGSSSDEAPGGFTSKERAIEFAQLMNSIPKIVYSRSLQQPHWGPVTIVREIDAAEIARQKRQPGKDLVLFAGGELASSFVKLDLFDEYRLMIHPIVVGNGMLLFRGLQQQLLGLKLQRARTFPSGVTLLHYTRAS